jgi:hypothetical protein
MMRTTLALATLLLVAPMTLPVATAEPLTRTTLRLVVVDETNAVLPSATVTVYTLDGKPGVRATADEYGVVYVPEIAPGLTQIVASYPGFSPALEKTTLEAGENAQVVKLQLAPVVEKVTVRATERPHASS